MKAKVKYPKQPVNMPVPIRIRDGCKVGWNVYKTEEEAKIASKYAAKVAEFKADLGHDFGYQSPGSITKVEDGFEVVFP